VASPRRPQQPSSGQSKGYAPIDKPDVNEAVMAGRSMRRRLYELEETQRWVHHAADFDSEEILTTPQDRPLGPLSRAERLSRLGHRFDPTVFDGPSYRLTPRRPYQSSPEAWLEVFNPVFYSSGGDLLWWEPPPDLGSRELGGYMLFHFATAPQERSLASLSLFRPRLRRDAGLRQLLGKLGSHRALRPDRPELRGTHSGLRVRSPGPPTALRDRDGCPPGDKAADVQSDLLRGRAAARPGQPFS
jgi:hypothetical protein